MKLETTICTNFIAPTLKINGEDILKNGFINAYIDDVDCDMGYKNCTYLLFKPPDIDVFNHFIEEEYERTGDIIDDYDYEGGYTVLVYKLNMKFEDDFNLVKKGMYSKTSEKFQKLFKKITDKGTPSTQHLIFTKDPKLKEYWEERADIRLKDEWEVWEGWSEDRETLDIKKIKENG